ncbi:MAG TPA: hypothetical protein PKN13_11750 [Accumulibacter sp.]|nr:hypothetical protein [Accumulibacter sp.]HNM75996.1 hypothetical protein [Accumulibacter sp.]HNO58622.1 hypothetical protein [Accumulibacter sp.]
MSTAAEQTRSLAALRGLDHAAALWWLALLYRKPRRFKDALAGLTSNSRRLQVGMILGLHALPYMFVLVVGVRLLLHAMGVIDLASGGSGAGTTTIVLAAAWGAAKGIAVGITLGIAGGIVVGLTASATFSITAPRAYYLLYAWAFVWPRLRGAAYPWHPVAWDDLCGTPFPGLDRLLVAYAGHDRPAALAEIERLIADYPSQRPAALRARSRLLIRQAAAASSLAELAALLAALPEGERGFLAETGRVKQWIGEISAVQRQIDTTDRPLFRAPLAELLVERVEHFGQRIAGLHEPLVSELRLAAANWLSIAWRQRDESQRWQSRAPAPQVFRAGDPVDREQEAFVNRLSVIGELERQVMLGTGCPGIVLYGRRRTGKSTVLVNLPGFLPATVSRVRISLQQPQAFTSLASLLELLVGRCREALAGTGRAAEGRSGQGAANAGRSDDVPAAPADFDLSTAFAFLSEVDSRLAADRRRLLIALDEYEMLDVKIGAGVLPLALLDTLRESIQSHRQITWLFAGSHALTELPNAPWSSYLVSARTIEVPLFSSEETSLLLTDPLCHASFYQQPGRQRPRFAADFWGVDGIAALHRQAGGWPHLVQLLAETAIDLANDRGRSAVDAALLDEAFEQAVVRGDAVLYELLYRECRLPGEWAYLQGFATHERQPPPGDPHVLAALRRRLLLIDDDGAACRLLIDDGAACRLRVPLMRRWLLRRGASIVD